MGFVPYLELLAELLNMQFPGANDIDSKIPGIIILIATNRDI